MNGLLSITLYWAHSRMSRNNPESPQRWRIRVKGWDRYTIMHHLHELVFMEITARKNGYCSMTTVVQLQNMTCEHATRAI
jgi:hypothetical protein